MCTTKIQKGRNAPFLHFLFTDWLSKANVNTLFNAQPNPLKVAFHYFSAFSDET